MSDWFENKLDDQLGNYGSPMDLNQAWEELEARRNRRRRPIWLWWSVGASVLVLALLLSLLSLNSTPTQPVGYFFRLTDNSAFQQEALSPIETATTKPTIKLEAVIKNHISARRLLPEVKSKAIVESVSEPIAFIPSPTNSSKIVDIAFLPVENQLLTTNKPTLSFTQPYKNEEQGQSSSLSNWELQVRGAYGVAHWPETPGPLDLQPVDGWNTFLGVRKRLFKQWNISSGVQLEQFYTRLTYSAAVSYEEIRPGQVVEIYQYEDGTEEEVISDAPVMVEEEIEFDAWQRHRFLSIPVLLGYTKPLGPKSALSFQAGPSFSFGTDHQGAYLQPSSTGAKVADIQDLNYKNSAIWSGMVSLQFERQLGHRWQLSAHIQGANQLTANRKDRDVYPEKFSFFGGGVGLSYRLN